MHQWVLIERLNQKGRIDLFRYQPLWHLNRKAPGLINFYKNRGILINNPVTGILKM